MNDALKSYLSRYEDPAHVTLLVSSVKAQHVGPLMAHPDRDAVGIDMPAVSLWFDSRADFAAWYLALGRLIHNDPTMVEAIAATVTP